MQSETNPVEVLSAASQRLGALAEFWRKRVEIEEAYLGQLSGLQVPDPPGDGQLQSLARKTRKILKAELAERTKGFEKFKAAYRALNDEFWAEEGPNFFNRLDLSARSPSSRIDSLASEIEKAKAAAKKLAIGAWEENFSLSSTSARRESQVRSNVLARFLSMTRTEHPESHHDTSSLGFLIADSAYRQKVQEINDEKYIVQSEIVPRVAAFVEQNNKCIAALKRMVNNFSDAQIDLAQVLNSTASQLISASNVVDASVESATFSEGLNECFTSLTQPYQYTSYEVSSDLRPTTMLFGCPLPDNLDVNSIGQRAVLKAFEVILSAAATKHPRSLFQAICDAHQRQGIDIKRAALELESLWNPSQPNGGQAAVDFLANAPSVGLLVYFLTRLPEPFLPLHESDIRTLSKMDANLRSLVKWDIVPVFPVTRVFGKAGNRMGTARRYALARLFLTLGSHEENLPSLVASHPEWFQMLTKATDMVQYPRIAAHFSTGIQNIDKIINQTFEDSLILPPYRVDELKRAGLLE